MAKLIQEFLSPGTWTNPDPSVVTRVRVTCIGGGGSGVIPPSIPAPVQGPLWAAGGGGGYRTAIVPVTGPAPVTVGAGGTAGGIGGSSSFNPGPTGLTADGGGGTAAGSQNAPSIGGGGGVAIDQGFFPAPAFYNLGGTGGLGYDAMTVDTFSPGSITMYVGGGMFSVGGSYEFQNNVPQPPQAGVRGAVIAGPSSMGVCGGGGSGIDGAGFHSPYSSPSNPVAPLIGIQVPTKMGPSSGQANTGGGGGKGGNGGSGKVIVEWWQ